MRGKQKITFILFLSVIIVQILVIVFPNISIDVFNLSIKNDAENSTQTTTTTLIKNNNFQQKTQNNTEKDENNNKNTNTDNNKSNLNTSTSSNEQNLSSTENKSESNNKNSSDTINKINNNDYKSPLNILLSDSNLTTYINATKNLSTSTQDKQKRLVIKIGLQILQSNCIIYENRLHFYSTSFTNSGNLSGKESYDLNDCIKRINAGQKIYTDCFGFVRLTYSIACLAINPQAPQNTVGLNKLYGYNGSYSDSTKITAIDKIAPSSVIMDRTTGKNGNRHVAIFLYKNGNNYYYMDQKGVFCGSILGNMLYSTASSTPYKFYYVKSYIQ